MQIYFSFTFSKIPYYAKILFDYKNMVTKKVLRKLFLKRLISAKLYCRLNRLKKNRKKKIYNRKPFLSSKFGNCECEKLFRFSKLELLRIKNVLGLPDICTAARGESFSCI